MFDYNFTISFGNIFRAKSGIMLKVIKGNIIFVKYQSSYIIIEKKTLCRIRQIINSLVAVIKFLKNDLLW